MNPETATKIVAELRSKRHKEIQHGKPKDMFDTVNPTCVGGVIIRLFRRDCPNVGRTCGRKHELLSLPFLNWMGMTEPEVNKFANWTEWHFYRKRSFPHVANLIEKRYAVSAVHQ